jgi:F-type H+-transporting ATPase subunit a
LLENSDGVLYTKKQVPSKLILIVSIVVGFVLVVAFLGIIVNLLFNYNDTKNVFQLKGTTDQLFSLVPHVMSIIIITIFLLVFMVIINTKIKKADPLKKPEGLVLAVILFVSTIDKFAVDMFGEKMKSLAPYIGYLAVYLFSANIFGLLGFTPPPTSNLSVTLSFGISTFLIIRYYGIKFNGWGHLTSLFKPFLLSPINIIGEIAFPFTLSLRLFGNILSGTLIMTLVYTGIAGGFNFILTTIFGSNLGIGELFAPFVGVPFLHIYFDLFSGFIQTFVFILLSSVFISSAAN